MVSLIHFRSVVYHQVIKPFGSAELMKSVEEALDLFVRPEMMTGSNQVKLHTPHSTASLLIRLSGRSTAVMSVMSASFSYFPLLPSHYLLLGCARFAALFAG